MYFKDPQQLILALSGFMFMFVNNGFSTWGNKYAQSLGLTAVQGGQIISAFSIAGIISSCLSGSIANKLKMDHKKFAALTLVGFGIMSALFGMVNGYAILIGIGVIYGAFAYFPSCHYTTLASMRAGDQFSATAIAAQNLIFQSASLVQPIIIGQIIDKTGNYSIIWWLFAAVCVCSAGICCAFNAAKKH